MAKSSAPKFNFSNLSSAELTALAIHYENSLMKTNKPTYPFLEAVLNTLGEKLEEIAVEKPEQSMKLLLEISAISSALTHLLPVQPEYQNIDELAEKLTEEQVKKLLIHSISGTFMIQQLNLLFQRVSLKITALQKGAINLEQKLPA